MSTEREEAEVTLIKAQTSLAKTCDTIVAALFLFGCAFGSFAFFGMLGEHHTACEFWRSVEAECHDSACLLEASAIRPWSCGPNDRSVVIVEAAAKARRSM